jgi:hypothetical protein
LVENTRVNGKVKQELVATLGSIDATLLDSFWADVGEDELVRLRVPDWRHRSLRARTDFWQGVLERMGKVGNNRLSQDQRKAIRREIHKVVPWVMEAEKKELEDLDAREELAAWKRLDEEGYAEQIVRAEKQIALYQYWIKDKQENIAVVQPVLDTVRSVVRSIEQGASALHPERVEARHLFTRTLLQLLAAQVGGGRRLKS